VPAQYRRQPPERGFKCAVAPVNAPLGAWPSSWSPSAERATLAKPVKAEGSEITEAVSQITWAGGEIKPGEFQLFTVSAGPLPTNTKSIEFKAVQTYSNGEVTRWIESTPKGGPEPEFPAPTLKLKLKGKSQEH
jgi:uncharacterized protein YcnI